MTYPATRCNVRRRKVTNNTGKSLGRELVMEIYRTMDRLQATDCTVNKCKYNRWAEVELFEYNSNADFYNAIDWHYNINVKEV